MKETKEQYDLIIDDAFNGPTPDPGLLTDEAVLTMKSHLRPEGAILMNVVMTLRGEGAFSGYRLRTNLENRFTYVRCFRCQEEKPEEEAQNCILVCSEYALPEKV